MAQTFRSGHAGRETDAHIQGAKAHDFFSAGVKNSRIGHSTGRELFTRADPQADEAKCNKTPDQFKDFMAVKSGILVRLAAVAEAIGLVDVPKVNRRVEIYCPKCEYVPSRLDLWACEPSCGCKWHTFDTCGVCPNCGKNWEETQCPSCSRWSPHAAWYHDFIEQERVDEMVVQA